MQKSAFKMQTGAESALRCVNLLSPHVLSTLAKRFIPARGTKPLPRYLWDMEDLKKQTKGKYTHEPLVLHRLGGRDPKTGLTFAFVLLRSHYRLLSHTYPRLSGQALAFINSLCHMKFTGACHRSLH